MSGKCFKLEMQNKTRFLFLLNNRKTLCNTTELSYKENYNNTICVEYKRKIRKADFPKVTTSA